MTRRAGTCVAAAALLSGCTASLGDLALISTRHPAVPGKVIWRSVSGESCAHKVVGIPLGKRAPDLDEAVAQAVAKVPGGVMLTNASVDNAYTITVFYNRSCIRVTGDVVGG